MAAHYIGTVVNNITARPVAGAEVSVLTAPSAEGGTAVTLYSDESVTEIDNPVTTDAYGFFEFYVADGHYTLEYAYNGTVRKVIEDVEMAESGAGDVGALELRMDAAEIVTGNATVIAFTGLADPDADRLPFWDESANTFDWLTASTGLTITGTSLTVDPVAAAGLSDPGADRIRFWDESANAEAWLEVSTGLSLTGTTLTATVSAYTDEMARDAIGAALAGGTGVTVTVNDAGDTITVALSQYILPFFFTSTPTASEVLMLHVAGAAFTIPANFTAALESDVGTNPTAGWALDVQQNGATIGTITVSTGGVVSATTTSGTSKSIAAGDVIKIVAPGSADATAANMAFTIVGER